MAVLKGGDKLDAELARIGQEVERGGLLRVGFLSGATYPARPPRKLRAAYAKRKAKGNLKPIKGAPAGQTVTVPEVAFWNEFGTKRIPPRPFFRGMIRRKAGEWGPALGGLLVKTKYNVSRSLAILGEGIAGQLRQSIIETNTPPNAAATIAKKGFNKPLVSTGHMLASVDSEVRDRS